MSERLEKAKTELAAKFAGSGFSQSVKFDVEDEGVILVNGENVSIGDGDADVTLSASADVFEEMVSGALDGQTAFLSGRLKIDGDMGLALQLGSILA